MTVGVAGPHTDTADLAVPMARHLASLRYEDLDDATVAATKRLVLDTVGAGVAAVGEDGCVEMLDLVREWGGAEQATVIGDGARVPLQHAVAVNATLCRALEIDDVSEVALIHPSATIVPVAIGAAEASTRPISGRELIATIAVATDVHNRLSVAPRVRLSGPLYRPRGMSCTYQVGTMIAAAIVARLAGADADAILSAIGVAYGSAAGNQQSIEDRTLGVRLQQGLSAMNGVIAARVSLRGVRGPHRPLEGRFGYYAMYWNNDYDRDRALEGLGTRLTVTDVSLKPYPCCKYTHTAVAAALDARGDPRFDPWRIERVELRVENAEYRSLVCDPIEEKRRPRTPIDAQFSMPYCVAVALLRGRLTLEDFRQEAVADPAIRALAERIDCVARGDTELGRKLPTPGAIEIRMRDGGTISAYTEYAPGHPARPLSWEETVAKFMRSVGFPARPLPRERSERLVRRIAKLEAESDVRDLVGSHLVW